MQRKTAVRAAAVMVVAGGLLGGGCLPYQLAASGNIFGAFLVAMSYGSGPNLAKPGKKTPPVKGTLDIPLTGSIGGLDGTFSIGLDKFGSFGGTAKIGKDHRSATLTIKDAPTLVQFVGSVLSDVAGEDIAITKATAHVTGRQTTGGVKKSWKGTITFKGTVLNGDNQGRSVKGTLKSKGTL